MPVMCAQPKAEFLDEIQTKVKSQEFSFLLLSHLYGFAQRFLVLQTHTTFYSFYSYYTLQRRKEEYPLLYGLRNPYRNIKSENSHKQAQKPQRNCMFMNLGFWIAWLVFSLLQIKKCTFCFKNILSFPSGMLLSVEI